MKTFTLCAEYDRRLTTPTAEAGVGVLALSDDLDTLLDLVRLKIGVAIYHAYVFVDGRFAYYVASQGNKGNNKWRVYHSTGGDEIAAKTTPVSRLLAPVERNSHIIKSYICEAKNKFELDCRTDDGKLYIYGEDKKI